MDRDAVAFAAQRIPASPAIIADGMVTIMTETPTEVLHRLTAWALGDGVELESLEVSRPSLEDVYLELTRA